MSILVAGSFPLHRYYNLDNENDFEKRILDVMHILCFRVSTLISQVPY